MTLTASFGVAGTRADRASLDTLFDHADRALYAAKLAGRNRVMRAGAAGGLAARASGISDDPPLEGEGEVAGAA